MSFHGLTAFRHFRHKIRRPQADAPDDGFTLLELLVVLGIIVLIATIAAPQVLRYLGSARTETAKAQISALSTALELYALDNGAFPAEGAGLKALVAGALYQAGEWHNGSVGPALSLSPHWARWTTRHLFPGARQCTGWIGRRPGCHELTSLKACSCKGVRPAVTITATLKATVPQPSVKAPHSRYSRDADA